MEGTAARHEGARPATRSSSPWGVVWPGAVLDAIVAVVVATFLVAMSPFTQVAEANAIPLDGAGYGLLALTGLAVAVRRRMPHVMYLLGVGSAVGYVAIRFPGWPVYWGAGIVLVAYLFTVGRAGWPVALTGGAALALATGRSVDWHPFQMLAVFVIWSVIAVFTAQSIELRRRRAEQDALHRVLEERLRIGREMHDVLSHSLATISLRSGTSLRLLETDPAEAEIALRSIRQVSNEALTQARTALGRIWDPALTNEQSAPDLDDLESLITSVRASGLSVRASVRRGGAVPTAIGSAAYRVIQEALTNVMRHAGPDACATVEVARGSDGIFVEVTDTGAPAGDAPPDAAPGHGLTSMRERVLELRGRFSAGPQPSGGFRIWAWLPIEDRHP